MARRAACFTLVTLSCVGAFVAPASRANFPSRTRARVEPLGATAADLLPGLLPGGDAIAASGNPDVFGALMHDAASPLLNVVNTGVGVGVGVAPPLSDGGVSAGWMLVSAAPPGDAYLATGLFGIAAAVIAVGAGVLVFSAVSGKDGLAAFLSKEKGSNPFYQDTITKLTPKTPEILNKIRLPELDFVEVYNQPPAADEFQDEDDSTFEVEGGGQDSNVVSTAESLRQRLLEAVQAKDYDLASSLERELASFLRRNGMNFEDDAK